MWEKVSVGQVADSNRGGLNGDQVSSHGEAVGKSGFGMPSVMVPGPAAVTQEEQDMEEVVQIEQTHAQDRDDADGGPEVSGRVMSEFRYHTDKVHACCADGETGMLYSASSDSTICCAPIKSGVPRPGRHAEEYVLRQHTDRVLAVVLTGGADGKVLLTGSADKTIRKWPLKPDGSPLRYNSVDGAYESEAVFAGHADWVSCLVVAEGSLFSGTQHARQHVCTDTCSHAPLIESYSDTQKGHMRTCGHESSYTHRHAHTHAGAWDSSIRKWDISTNRFIAELLGHQDPIYCLAAVGEVLLSGSRDCCVRAWHTDTCECLRVYEGHTAVVSSIVAVDPIMYTASWDKTIRKWDLAKGTCRIFRCSGCTHQ